jgi:hypothetical protein
VRQQGKPAEVPQGAVGAGVGAGLGAAVGNGVGAGLVGATVGNGLGTLLGRGVLVRAPLPLPLPLPFALLPLTGAFTGARVGALVLGARVVGARVAALDPFPFAGTSMRSLGSCSSSRKGASSEVVAPSFTVDHAAAARTSRTPTQTFSIKTRKRTGSDVAGMAAVMMRKS